MKYGEAITSHHRISSGVPHGSVLGPILYLIYTADLPVSSGTLSATFADDTAILTSSKDPEMASHILQRSLDDIQKWMRLWRIKTNESKSVHITFTLCRGECPPVLLNGAQVPRAEIIRYLGMHLDRRLTWKSISLSSVLQLHKMY